MELKNVQWGIMLAVMCVGGFFTYNKSLSAKNVNREVYDVETKNIKDKMNSMSTQIESNSEKLTSIDKKLDILIVRMNIQRGESYANATVSRTKTTSRDSLDNDEQKEEIITR